MPGKRVDQNIIQLVYFNHYKGKTAKEIAKMFSLKLRTVYNIINRAENEERLEMRQTTGRPKNLTRTDENKIIKTVYNNPQRSTRSLAQEMKNDCGVTVSHETVRKVYYSRIARKKNHYYQL